VTRRHHGHLTIAALVVTAVALIGGPLASARPTPHGAGRAGRAAGTIELVSQTPTVALGGTFDMWVRLADLPADGLLELVLHGRVRSRSELAQSMEGNGLRSQIYRVKPTVAELPVAADGSRRLSLSLDPTTGGIPLSASGAYPVEVIAQDASGVTLATLITHLLVRPAAADESPPLAVAVVAEIGAPPALQPDGTIELGANQVDRVAGLAAALAATPEVPATLAISPETLDALAAGADPVHATVLDQLRAAATDRTVLARPYVDVSPDVLDEAGLGDELDRQLEHGSAVLEEALGTEPSATSWIAGPDLGDAGMRALEQAGVQHLVVSPDQLEPLRSGVLSLSLAQPFLVAGEPEPTLDAMALDPAILERLGTTTSVGLEVSRLLAELAMLWFEQPGIARGAVLPLDGSVRGEVLEALLAGLDAGGIFEAVDLDDLFASAAPLRQPGGGRVDRALVPSGDGARLSAGFAADLEATRSLLRSFVGLVGDDSPRADPVATQLLLATATGLSGKERTAHVASARAAIDAVVTAVSAPTHGTVTLTAREGTVPITLRNDAGVPVNVVVRLRSPKLEFPAGDTIPLTLTEATMRLDIEVRTRASGAFPLDVEITSPDGVLMLATVDYSVRSTAVSGVGVVLSAGAALFLLTWWTRHWRRTRRSRKLVATAHPAQATPAGAGAQRGTADAPPK
jgi:hypothetical protein